jgi:hypothetical protein
VTFLKDRWVRFILVLGVLGGLFLPSVILIFDPDFELLLGAVFNTAFLVACYFAYRRRWPDVTALGLCAFELSLLIVFLAGKVVFDGPVRMPWEFGMLVMAIVVLLVFGCAALWLRNVHRAMQPREDKGQAGHE